MTALDSMLVKTTSTSNHAGNDPTRTANAGRADSGDGAGVAGLSVEGRGTWSDAPSRPSVPATRRGGRAPLIASTALCPLQPCSPERGTRAATAAAKSNTTLTSGSLGIIVKRAATLVPARFEPRTRIFRFSEDTIHPQTPTIKSLPSALGLSGACGVAA
eukprot:scaffold263_cov120-Isochrysis_galbana.AAC.10